MPYIEADLKKMSDPELNKLYKDILHHKTSTSEEKKTHSKTTLTKDRKKLLESHKEYVYKKNEAKTPKQQKEDLIKHIIKLQEKESIGEKHKENIDYKKFYEEGHQIHEHTGHELRKELPPKFNEHLKNLEVMKDELIKEKSEYRINLLHKKMVTEIINMKKELKNIPNQKQREDSEMLLSHEVHNVAKEMAKHIAGSDDEKLKKIKITVEKLKGISNDEIDKEIDKEIERIDGHLKLLKEQQEGDVEHVVEEHKEELQHLLGEPVKKEPYTGLAGEPVEKEPEVKKAPSHRPKPSQPDEVKEEMKEPFKPTYREGGKNPESQEKQLNRPFIKKPILSEEEKEQEQKEKDEMQPVEFSQENLTSKGDKNIGNVRTVGFLGPMDALAKEDDVVLEETERSKSLKRFTNFRWVDSIQNSALGHLSPFQRIQDLEDKRRYSKCFIPKNKMPVPPPDDVELEKHKNFNKYEMVPSFNLSGAFQPATEFSFKTSRSALARKVNIDEKQFGDKKLYNFDGEGRPNMNPHNPFSASYGMQRANQTKLNADLQDNTLEYSAVMYSDDPFKRKHKHLPRTKIFYS